MIAYLPVAEKPKPKPKPRNRETEKPRRVLTYPRQAPRPHTRTLQPQSCDNLCKQSSTASHRLHPPTKTNKQTKESSYYGVGRMREHRGATLGFGTPWNEGAGGAR